MIDWLIDWVCTVVLVYRRSAVAVKYTSIFSYLNLSLSSVYVVCIHLEYYSSHFVLLITPLLLPFLTIPLPIFAWSSLLTYTLPSSSPNLLFLFLNLLPSPPTYFSSSSTFSHLPQPTFPLPQPTPVSRLQPFSFSFQPFFLIPL